MEKSARKRREDPAQESIVSKKDELNARVKQLISLWIETKRGWNGRPAPGIGINEKGNIKNPLPDEVSQAAKAIDMKTDEILDLLRVVTDEQNQYSGKRRKGRREMGIPDIPAEEIPVELPKAASLQKDAGKLSRFWTHVKAPFQTEDVNRWERLKMLRSVARIASLSKDIEDLILTDGPTVVPAIYKAKDMFYYLRHNLVVPLLQQKNISDEPYTSLHSEFSTKRRERKQESAKRIREELKAEQARAKSEDAEQRREDRIELERMKQESREDRFDYVNKLRTMRNAVNALKKDVKDKPPALHNAIIDFEMATEFDDQVEAFERIRELSSGLYKNAHNILSRWMKRKYMEYQDTSQSELRLSIDQELRRAREHLSVLMGDLETPGVSVERAINNLIDFMRDSVPMLKMLSDLAEIYNDEAKSMQFKTRDKKRYPIISALDMRDVKAMAGIMYEDVLRLENKLSELKTDTISEKEIQESSELPVEFEDLPEEVYGYR